MKCIHARILSVQLDAFSHIHTTKMKTENISIHSLVLKQSFFSLSVVLYSPETDAFAGLGKSNGGMEGGEPVTRHERIKLECH